MHPPEAVRFGPYEIRLRSQELFKHGLRLRLVPQAFQVLRILLEQPGQLVTREDLHQALWPADTFVDFDHGLNNAIKRIRDVLNDSVDAPVYIETLPRLGYRFIGPVNGNGNQSTPARVAEPPAVSMSEVRESQPAEKTGRWSRVTVVIGTAALVGLAASVWWFFLRSPQALTGKDSIPLADFLNTTGDAVFDDTLRQRLSVQLEQSPFVSIVSDQQVQQALQMMGQKTNANGVYCLNRY